MTHRSLATLSVAILSLAACGPAIGAGDGADSGTAAAPAPLPIDVPRGRWARSASDLGCDPIVDDATLERFLEEHRATYLVPAGRAGVRGEVHVYDTVSECSAVCLAVCEGSWLCQTLHCGPRSDRDEDRDQMDDEAGASGLPTTRREPPPDDDRPQGGSGRDDRFAPPDPGGHPGR